MKNSNITEFSHEPSPLLIELLNAKLITSDNKLFDMHELLEELDRIISSQLTDVIHHPEFQRLEGNWRGLHYLVSHTDTCYLLKIRFLNISKDELAKDLLPSTNAEIYESAMFAKTYKVELDQLGGEPYAFLIGDYYFDSSEGDVELMTALSKLCAVIHAPFVSGASANIIGLERWQDFRMSGLDSALNIEGTYWERLRSSDLSRYCCLTLPRFLARDTYKKLAPSHEEFAYTEPLEGTQPEQFTWANSAYLMAANIGRSFSERGYAYHFCGLESGGLRENLPVQQIQNEKGKWVSSSAEIVLSVRSEYALAKLGLVALLSLYDRIPSGSVAFLSAGSIHKPRPYDDPGSSADSVLASRLPYVFSACRFSQYLKIINRNRLGAFVGRDWVEAWLNKWLAQYIDNDPANSSDEIRAKKPIEKAHINLYEVEGFPEAYLARLIVGGGVMFYRLTSTEARLLLDSPYARSDYSFAANWIINGDREGYTTS